MNKKRSSQSDNCSKVYTTCALRAQNTRENVEQQRFKRQKGQRSTTKVNHKKGCKYVRGNPQLCDKKKEQRKTNPTQKRKISHMAKTTKRKNAFVEATPRRSSDSNRLTSSCRIIKELENGPLRGEVTPKAKIKDQPRNSQMKNPKQVEVSNFKQKTRQEEC